MRSCNQVKNRLLRKLIKSKITMSTAEKRLKRIYSTLSQISTFSIEPKEFHPVKSSSSSVALESFASDHALKTNYMSYQRKALSRLDEDRTHENITRNIIKISANQLFNLLNQETLHNFPKLSDPNFLLILDTRSAEEFAVGHIVTSRHVEYVDGDFQPLYGWDLECKQNLVVYDTFSLAADHTSRAFRCALLLYNSGCRNPVRILNGGYADFCKFYPDYNTIQIIYTPKELDDYPTYPNEIIPGKIYMGRLYHAQAPFVHKELKIKAHVSCEIESTTAYFPDNYPFKFNIPVNESESKALAPYFVPVSDFIESNSVYNQAVLVYSESGNAIPPVIIMAYLISKEKLRLETAYKAVKQCRNTIRPILQHMKELLDLEMSKFESIFQTDIEQLIQEKY